MPELEGLIPIIVAVVLLCLAAIFIQWFFAHPMIFVPVVLFIGFLVYRARARTRV